jgi:outer membrane protein insertion porin family
MRGSKLSSGSSKDVSARFRKRLPHWLIYPILTAILVTVLSPLPVKGEDIELAPDREKTYQISFQGNAALSETALRNAAAQELKAFERQGQRRSDVDDAAFQMEIAYRKAGYAFAQVDYRTERVGGRQVVTFSISEGPRIIVKKIDIAGTAGIDAEKLITFFEGEKTGAFGQGKLLFIKSNIQSAISQIREFYISQGYLQAVVEPPRISFSEDRTQATVTIQVREGLRYTIRDVRFQGDLLADAEDPLRKQRGELVGKPYFRRRKLVLQSRVIEVYGNLGYPNAVVEIEETQGHEPRAVVLVAAIDKGPLVTISDTVVRGNEKTREKFIRSRLSVKPGDRFDLEKQNQSFRQLYQTGLFQKVDVRLEEREGTDSWPLVVDVKEAPSRELYVEPGWGSYEKLRLRAGFLEKNLFGTGRMGSMDVSGSIKARGLVATLSDPWFLNTDVKADLPAYYSQREEPSFTRKDAGASMQFSKSLSKHLSVNAGYGFRITELTDLAPDAAEADIPRDYDLAAVNFQTTYDTRNDLFFPTHGQKAFISLEHADRVLGGEITFSRITGGMRFFMSLARNTILGMRYGTGLIIPGPDDYNLPVSERFFNGGENTVRSFRQSELGPRDGSGDPAGGLAFNVINVELRQRLMGNLTGTVFFDYGNVSPNRTRSELGLPPYESRSGILSDTFEQYFKDFRPGVGCGIQYLLPVGAARIDFAVNPDRDKTRGEDLYAVHFSVGMAF